MFDTSGISGLADFEQAPKLRIAICGEPKTGKSWLADTIPGSIYHADFDGRIESIREFIRKSGRKDIIAKTYWDYNPAQPVAVSQFESDIAMFEYAKQQGKEIPENFILDSMTYLKVSCEHELVKQHPAMSRTVKLGANSIKIPQGYDIINGNKDYLQYMVGRCAALGNVIAIFHEQDEKDNARSTKDNKAFTGRKTIQPQYLSSLLSIFNDVFRIIIDYSGKRIVTTQPSSDFLASTSMALDVTEEADLAAMLAKHAKASGK